MTAEALHVISYHHIILVRRVLSNMVIGWDVELGNPLGRMASYSLTANQEAMALKKKCRVLGTTTAQYVVASRFSSTG